MTIATIAVLRWFTFLAPTLWVFFLIYAYKNDRSNVNMLYAGALFGYFLEYSSIVLFKVYYYNPDWPFNPLGTPITVSFSWAVFIYGTKVFFDSTNISKKLRPIAYAVFATTIDWAMDPIAVRLTMWTWSINVNGVGDKQYFGIPWANYWAWLSAVSVFTFCYTYITENPKWPILKKYSIISIMLFSVIGTAITNGLYFIIFLNGTDPTSGGRFQLFQMFLVVGIYTLGAITIFKQKIRFTKPLVWIPAAAYLANIYSYLLFGIIDGFFSNTLILIIFLFVTIILTYLTIPQFHKNFDEN